LAAEPAHLDSPVDAKALCCTTTAGDSSSGHSGNVHAILFDAKADEETINHGRSTVDAGCGHVAASERARPTQSDTETQPVKATGDDTPTPPSSGQASTPHIYLAASSPDKAGSALAPTFGSANPAPVVVASTAPSKDAGWIPSVSHDDNWQIRSDIIPIAASHRDAQPVAQHSDISALDSPRSENSFHFRPADPQHDTSDFWGPAPPTHIAASERHDGGGWTHRGSVAANDPPGHDAIDLIGVPRGHASDAVHAHYLIA
jgi:hypothetical protein